MKKYFVFSAISIFIIISVIKINIINTEILSPVGNFQDNFNKINEEFGDDFSEFIMDKSPVKIYLGEVGDNSATVKINKKEINLTKDNPFLNVFTPIISIFKNGYKNIEKKFDERKNIEKEVNKEEKNSELEGVVNDFINSLEGE